MPRRPVRELLARDPALDAMWMDLLSDLRKPGPAHFFVSAATRKMLQRELGRIEADLRRRYPDFDDHCKAQEKTE